MDAFHERLARIDSGDGRPSKVDLGVDWRANEPIQMTIGPVLHPDNARDFIDIDAALQSGRSTMRTSYNSSYGNCSYSSSNLAAGRRQHSSPPSRRRRVSRVVLSTFALVCRDGFTGSRPTGTGPDDP